jgi:6-phosphogluconolactonase/glucosamine-6-phosphate isomerase/deaminase
MEIHRYNDQAQQLEKLVDGLATSIIDELSAGRRVVLFLSGGSAVNVYRPLTEQLLQNGQDLSNLVFGVVDERFSKGDAELPGGEFNSSKIADSLNLVNDKAQVNLYRDPEEADAEFARYQKFLEEVFLTPGIVKFAVLGIGPDQHTAGIKPASELGLSDEEFLNLFYSGQLLVEYSGTDFPVRVTLSFDALEQLDTVFVNLVNKPEILTQLVELHDSEFKKNLLPKSPMQILLKANDVRIFAV